MKCTICNQPVILIPSAQQRAERFGGTAADYTAIFTTHALCTLRQRAEATSALLQKQ